MADYSYVNEIPYLSRYIDEEGFRIDKLIDDDFLQASKLLWREGKYISALKLILSFIDTMAFLENGTTNGTLYKSWLDKYVDLASLGVTSEEVWEHRNALLHMTTYTSRKVAGGKVLRLAPYIVGGGLEINDSVRGIIDEYPHAKNYNLRDFFLAVTHGVIKYVEKLNSNPETYEPFLKNYDEILSDVRYLKIFQEEGME